MRGLLPKLITLIACLIVAATAQVLAFAMTGAGHGWLAPFVCSLLLWLTYPAVGLSLLGATTAKARSSAFVDVWLFGAAAAADLVLLLINDWSHMPWFYRNYPGLVVAWAVLWIGWQVPPAWQVSKRLAARL